MDKVTSVLAAIDAGKLPSTEQAVDAIEWFIHEIIPQARPNGPDELSSQGRILAADIRNNLEAYKQFFIHKNSDNLLQQALWHLNEADLSDTSTNIVDTQEATNDMKKIRSAIRTIVEILWVNSTSQGSSIFEDFASFSRLALANAAETFESQAGRAKDSLREIDEEVQKGERDVLGRKRRRLEEEKDPKVAFAHGMDTVKDAGVSVIGTAQDATAAVEEHADKASSRVRDAYFQICDRAQSDPKYHDAISTLFDTVQKWVTRSLDTASDVNKSTDLESFIDDPTPEQHVPKALRGIGTFIERLSGDKPLDDLYSKLRACVVDIRQDDDLQTWFNQFFDHLRKSVDEPGYARSDEATERRKALSNKWQELKDETSDSGKKWQADWEAFKKEWADFEKRIIHDKDLHRISQAHAKLGQDIERGLIEAGDEAASGLEAAMQQVSWFWQDLFKVYAPKAIELLKDVPIPRTEYKDAEVEFVLENLDISSFKLLPSHIYIRNITDVDITTDQTSSHTAVGTLTRIHAQGVQMHLKDVSFWYKDKTATVGPSEYSGLLGFKLPEKGIDVDIRVRLIPATPPGQREGERERLRAYHTIDRVEVDISQDVELEVKESNHSVLISVFKPILLSRFRDALARALAEQVRSLLNNLDALAWDINARSEVFADTGLSTGPAMIAAIWSEVGRMVRQSDGSGWRATGTGIVKQAGEGVGSQGQGASFAVGAEPQILSGDKRGPLGTASEPLAQKAQRIGEEVKQQGQDIANQMDIDVDVQAKAGDMNQVKDQAKDVLLQGKHTIESFGRAVEAKAEEERKKSGWQSGAYDIRA